MHFLSIIFLVFEFSGNLNTKALADGSGRGLGNTEHIDVLIDVGLGHFLKGLKFQPANLDGVSVYSVELIVRSLERLALAGLPTSRAQFESGNLKNKYLKLALAYAIDALNLDPKLRRDGTLDPASIELLKDLKKVVRYARNPAWRGYYGEIYKNSLKPMIYEVLYRNADPLKLARAKPEKTQVLNEKTGKIDDYLLYEFEGKDGEKIPAQLLLPNSEHLLQFRPSEVVKAVKDTARVFPVETALFYVAANVVSAGTQLFSPHENPHGLQDSTGMYFSKDTLLDFGELFHLFTFMAGARVTGRAMDVALKRSGVSMKTQVLARPLINYFSLAGGSLISELIADSYTSMKNCYLGYMSNPKNFASPMEQAQHVQNCDLAYNQWIRNKMAYKYLGSTMRVIAAAAAASATSYAFNSAIKGIKALKNASSTAGKAKQTYSTLKLIAPPVARAANQIIVTGIEMGGAAAAGVSTAAPHPGLRILGWAGRGMHLVVFMAWDRVVESFIMKPYYSWDLSTEADNSEKQLLSEFQNFSKGGGVITRKYDVESCGNLFQQWKPDRSHPSRLLDTPTGPKCYDGTIFQSLDNYADDQKSWRELILQKVNASYVAWVEQSVHLVNRYQDTRLFYQDFVDKTNYQSSILFGDANPYAGMNGIVDNPESSTEDDKAVFVADDGSLSIAAMKVAQERNISTQAEFLGNWIASLETPEGQASILKFYSSNFESPDKTSDPAAKKTENDPRITNLVSNLKFIEKGLRSANAKETKAALQQIWDLSKHYDEYCIAQFNALLGDSATEVMQELNFDVERVKRDLKKTGTPEKEQAKKDSQAFREALTDKLDGADIPPLCYFSELRRRFGNTLPGSISNSETYLQGTTQALIKLGAKDDYPKEFRGIPAPNIASYLLINMACGMDLTERQSWLSRIMPGIKSNTSDRGWEITFGESPKSSVSDPFGFKMDFYPPRLTNDFATRCKPQYKSAPNRHLPVLRTFDEYRWYDDEGKKFSSLSELVANTLYDDVLDKADGPPKPPNEGEEAPQTSFDKWWGNHVERHYNNALDIASANYKKMIRDRFLPAIYGYREYLDQPGTLKDCQFDETDSTDGSGGPHGGMADLMYSAELQPNNPSPQQNVQNFKSKNGFLHMDPPRYVKRQELENCHGGRHKYLPIVSAVRLEFELYLDHLIRPLFREMFSRDKRYNNEEMLKKAENIFIKNREWILTSLEMLMKYKPDQNGTVGTDHLDRAKEWLMLNILSLELKIGVPVDANVQALLRAVEGSVNFIDPDQDAFPYGEWQYRQLRLKELAEKYLDRKKGAPQFAAYEGEMSQLSTPPWENLTEDERLFIHAVL
ncbi:MAG: hypothetical protein IPL83_18425 [Bdellovibrionales bacterium]|nr:hypothetical protein [Bdellovibrionales bacterium]